MSVVLSQTEEQVALALWNLLIKILPEGVEVVKGQENRVGVPVNVDYVVFTILNRTRMGTNIDRYADPVKRMLQKVQINIQLDIHGPHGADNTQVITTVAQDSWSAEYFKTQNVEASILYASEPRQAAWTTGENQFENRWTFDMSIQANVVVGVPQEFADKLVLAPIGVP